MRELKGLQERTESKTKRLQVKYDCICMVAKGPTEGYEPIIVQNPETKDQVTKYIKPFGALEVMVTKLRLRDTEDQFEHRFLSWELSCYDNQNEYILSIPFGSTAANRFMKMAEMVDWAEPVEFEVWRDMRGKAPKTAFTIKQNDAYVSQTYTKDNQGDCPPWEELIPGKWNSDRQNAWLAKQMLDVVVPRIAALNPEPAAAGNGAKTGNEPPFASAAAAGVDGPPYSEPYDDNNPSNMADDDIPF